MTEYPIKVMNRAREIWLDFPAGGTPPSYATVAKRLNKELGIDITRKTVHEWSVRFAWEDSPSLAGSPPPASAPGGGVGSAPAPSPVEPAFEDIEDWDWEAKKLKFLGKLTGIAESCLDVGAGPDGQPMLLFKDTESRVKTGLAAVELIGKIQSGKFERAEKTDMLPTLSKNQLNQMFQFFFVAGSPEPKISRERVMDAEFEEVEPQKLLPAPEEPAQ